MMNHSSPVRFPPGRAVRWAEFSGAKSRCRALVYSRIVQGFSTPPLLLLSMLMTSNRRITGDNINTLPLKLPGWITVAAIFSASVGLVVSWLI
jgi:Mn2+/Fe2+ NRAMP family transporter